MPGNRLYLFIVWVCASLLVLGLHSYPTLNFCAFLVAVYCSTVYFQEIFEQHQITQKKKCTRGKRDLKFQQDHNLMAVVGMLVGFIFGIAVLLIYYIQTKEKLNFNGVAGDVSCNLALAGGASLAAGTITELYHGRSLKLPRFHLALFTLFFLLIGTFIIFAFVPDLYSFNPHVVSSVIIFVMCSSILAVIFNI